MCRTEGSRSREESARHRRIDSSIFVPRDGLASEFDLLWPWLYISERLSSGRLGGAAFAYPRSGGPFFTNHTVLMVRAADNGDPPGRIAGCARCYDWNSHSIALLAWAADVSRLLFDILLPAILVSVVTGLFVAIRRSKKRSLQTEASRWLAERRSGIALRDIKWRRRGIYFASSIPVSMVLLFFLFLPEVWGMLSHLGVPQSGNCSGSQLPIPPSWIVLRHDNQAANGWSISSGLAGRGIWHGWSPYLRGPMPFISWSFGTKSRDEDASMNAQSRTKDDEIIGQRVFTIGLGNVSCVEYKPTYLSSLYNRWGEHIDCSDSGRFFANYAGPKPQVEKFYEVLGGIIQVK